MTASAYVQTRCFAGCPAPLIATTSRTTLLAHRAATTLDRFGLRESANWSHTPILAASCAWKDPCGGIQGSHSRRAMHDPPAVQLAHKDAFRGHLGAVFFVGEFLRH